MLDPEGRADVLALIERLRSDGHGILHITHDLSDVVTADRVVVLHGGGPAFSGSPEDLLAEPELLASWGLELTPLMRLAGELRSRGIEVPAAVVEPTQVIESLWP